jgi:hypothetical protein
LVLLSNYGIWNHILDEVSDSLVAQSGEIGEDRQLRKAPPVASWEDALNVHLEGREPWEEEMGNYYDIQASVPYVDITWVRDITRYDMTYGFWTHYKGKSR